MLASRFIHLNEQSTKCPKSATAAVTVPVVAVPVVAGKCLKSVPANDGHQLGSIVRQKLSCVHKRDNPVGNSYP
jgi:hypothetical protein